MEWDSTHGTVALFLRRTDFQVSYVLSPDSDKFPQEPGDYLLRILPKYGLKNDCMNMGPGYTNCGRYHDRRHFLANIGAMLNKPFPAHLDGSLKSLYRRPKFSKDISYTAVPGNVGSL